MKIPHFVLYVAYVWVCCTVVQSVELVSATTPEVNAQDDIITVDKDDAIKIPQKVSEVAAVGENQATASKTTIDVQNGDEIKNVEGQIKTAPDTNEKEQGTGGVSPEQSQESGEQLVKESLKTEQEGEQIEKESVQAGEQLVKESVKTEQAGQQLVKESVKTEQAGQQLVKESVKTEQTDENANAASGASDKTEPAHDASDRGLNKSVAKRLRQRHRKPNAVKATLVSLILITMLAGGQVLLVSWKKNSPKSFTRVTLAGLWIIPLIFNISVRYYRFLVLWTCFTILMARILYQATRTPLNLKTPQRVYLVLDRLYRLCNAMGTLGYGLLIFEMMGFRALFRMPADWIGPPSLVLLFYGLYFGVMTRDFTEVAADRIANTVGAVKYENPPHNLCALCGEELRPTLINQREGDEPPKIFKLDCNHEFHERCIRGWTIVGKRDTCPFCTEKVNLKPIIGSSPWYQGQSLLWIQILDTMRYMIVWNPLLLLSVQAIIYLLGLNAKPDDMTTGAPTTITLHRVDGHARPAWHN